MWDSGTRVERAGPASRAQTALGWLARGAACLLLVVLLGYPVRTFLLEPTTAPWLKLVWLGALVGGFVVPFWALLLTLVIIPMLPVVPHLSDGVPQGVVHLVVVAQAVPGLVRVAAGKRRWPTDAVFHALVVFVAVALGSVAAGYAGLRLSFDSFPDFAAEIHRFLSTYLFNRPGPEPMNPVLAWFTLLTGLLTYVTVRSEAPGAGRAVLVLRAIVLAGLGVAAMGWWQSATGVGLQPTWLVFDPILVRVNSTYSDPNALAAFLAMLIPMACGLAGAAAGWRAVWVAVVGGLAAGLVLTAGRAGYAGAVVGVCLLLFAAIRGGLDRRDPSALVRRYLRRLAAAAAVLLVAAFLTATVVGTAADIRHRDQASYVTTVLYTLNLRRPLDETLKGRLTIWRTAGRMVAHEPAFGIGLGRIYREFPWYNTEGGAGIDRRARLSAHSTFLNIAAELGLVGLAAWLLLLSVVYIAAFRRPDGETREHAWIRLGAASGLAAFGVTMFTGDRTILNEDVAMYFASVALAVTLGRPPGRPAFRWAMLACLVALAVTWPLHARSEQRQVRLDRIAWGFHGAERDNHNEVFRWTTGHATFHVPGQNKVLTLPIRGLAPFPQHITIRLDGRVVDEVTLADHDWHRLRYVLPSRRSDAPYHRIELIVSPLWRIADDPRELGVLVGGEEWPF